MKTVLNNFIYTLRKYKASTALNLLGLTVALASFLIISIQVYQEYSFEDCHSKAPRIYRVDGLDKKTGDTWSIHSRPFTMAIINSSPHILGGTLINPYIENFYLTTSERNIQKGFKENITICDPDIVHLFDFKMIEGDADCLKKPENVLLPESIAKKMFGNESAIGKQINLSGSLWSKQNGGFLVVGGVFKDFPENTQLQNFIYTAISQDYAIQDWQSSNYFCYILLDENTKPEDIVSNFNTHFDYKKISLTQQNQSIRLTPLKLIYFMNTNPSGKVIKSGNKTKPLLLITIGILVMVIAIINYTNFNMALAPVRIRSINTRKIFGSTNASLRMGIIGEAILLSLVAFIVASGIVFCFSQSHTLSFLRIDISPIHNLLPSLFTLGAAILSAIIASVRPAYHITSCSPELVLKRNFGLTASGQRTRTFLIGFQFVVSITLIIVSVFIYKQNNFLRNYALGYNTKNLAVVELPQSMASEHKQSFVSALKANTDIEDVAFSFQKFGASDNYRTWSGNFKGENIGFYSLSVSYGFLDAMKIPLLGGRKPNETTDDQNAVYYIINKGMSKKYNIRPGDIIDVEWLKIPDKPDNGRVLGIVDNLKFKSLRKNEGNPVSSDNDSENMVLVFNDHNLQTCSYIRIRQGADIQKTSMFIEKTIANFDAAYPVNIQFYDQLFADLYKQEKDTAFIVGGFSLLAVVISIVGVFGLVMFECQYKRKEISIRKVLGSSTADILGLFNKTYFWTFTASFVLAIPLAYYILRQWLTNFAYKTSLDWWVFALAGISVMTIILATVTFQSWRSANANPVNALKNE